MEIRKFQVGGEMPTAAPAAQPAAGQDPLMEIAALFSEGLQSGDCNMLAQGAEAFLMLLQQAGSAEQAPVGAAPEGQPVFKKGGKLAGYKKGNKMVKKSCK
jgi:hypothetical protein